MSFLPVPQALIQSKKWAWGLTTLWAIAVVILSSLSPDEAPKVEWEIPHLDKVVHFIMFGCGGLLLTHALRLTSQWSWRTVILIGFLGICLFAILDEYHQTHTEGRSGNDLGDLAADFTGALAGAFLVYRLYARYRKSTTAH